MENKFFVQAQKIETDKQEKTAEIKPLSAEFFGGAEEKPMDYRDHLKSLKLNIQEKTSQDTNEISPEEIKKIQDLISPELMLDYKKILLDFKKKAVKNEEHPERELIDVSDEEIQQKIDAWVEQLKQEILSKKSELSEDDFVELENLSRIFFDSMAATFNAHSIELDIKELLDEKKYSDIPVSLREDVLNQISEEIKERYGFTAAEAKILIEFQIGKEAEYNPRVLFSTLDEIFKQYNLDDKKLALGKISAGYIISRIFKTWAPERVTGLSFGNSTQDLIMSASALVQFYSMDRLADLVDARTRQELNTYLNELSKNINERITNSVFFQEFEFMHEKESGELFTTMENGKKSILELTQSFISDFAPTGLSIISALAFLSKINPILGVAGVTSLPITYHIAKKKQKELNHLYKDARERQSKIYSHLNSVKTGFEEVRISPDIDSIAMETREMMDTKDDISLERNNKELISRQAFEIPYDVSVGVTTALSLWLQQKGEIPPGAVVSGLMYNGMLQKPLNNLVSSYFNQYSYAVEDIRKMNDVFGAYEKIDKPEGEKEESRTAVSDLKNLDIKLNNASFKNVFKDLDLEFKQGEFVTISGSSGVGKTTILRNIAGLYRPDSGSVEIGGINVKEIKRYGNESLYSIMTYCNQSPIIFTNMTLKENLTLWTKKDVPDEKIVEVLQRLKLEKFANKIDKRVSFFSGGERVRLGIARMLLKDPKIILLDEPTESLDSTGKSDVRNIIKELHKNNPEITIICVSHDQELLEMGDKKVSLGKDAPNLDYQI